MVFRLAYIGMVLGFLWVGQGFAQTVTVKVKVANVRQTPDLKARVVGKLTSGQRFDVLDKNASESWYLISTGKVKGWVHRSVVEIEGVEDSEADAMRQFSEQYAAGWRWVGGSRDGTWYYHKQRLSRDGDIVKAWVKQIKQDGAFSVWQNAFNCQTNSVGYGGVAEYDKDGKMTDRVTRPSYSWTGTVPGSFGESMLEKICKASVEN